MVQVTGWLRYQNEYFLCVECYLKVPFVLSMVLNLQRRRRTLNVIGAAGPLHHFRKNESET